MLLGPVGRENLEYFINIYFAVYATTEPSEQQSSKPNYRNPIRAFRLSPCTTVNRASYNTWNISSKFLNKSCGTHLSQPYFWLIFIVDGSPVRQFWYDILPAQLTRVTSYDLRLTPPYLTWRPYYQVLEIELYRGNKIIILHRPKLRTSW